MPPRKASPLATASALACVDATKPVIHITKLNLKLTGGNTGQRTLNCLMFFDLEFKEFIGRITRIEQSKHADGRNPLKNVIPRKLTLCRGATSGFWFVFTATTSFSLLKWWSIAKVLGADSYCVKNDFCCSTSWYDFVVTTVPCTTVADLFYNERVIAVRSPLHIFFGILLPFFLDPLPESHCLLGGSGRSRTSLQRRGRRRLGGSVFLPDTAAGQGFPVSVWHVQPTPLLPQLGVLSALLLDGHTVVSGLVQLCGHAVVPGHAVFTICRIRCLLRPDSCPRATRSFCQPALLPGSSSSSTD